MSGIERAMPSVAPNLTEVLSGTVFRLHRKAERGSERGLPKPSVSEVVLTPEGVEGDFNRYRHEEKRDDPEMAVLLERLETLKELEGEGWPVAPGDIGENVTTVGIAYHEFFPGRSLEIGTARLTVTKPCTPCENLYLLPYVGHDRGPAFLRAMLGRRGWYARVDRAGSVQVAEPIRLFPP